MGKSSSQVVGYRYYAKFAAFIGNRIEKLIGINFDNRKWIVHDPLKHPPNLLPVLEGNLFGENEGGVSGNIDIHFGTPDQEPNAEYQKYFPLVSGYPYQSYLVFRSLTGGAPSLGEGLSPAGFYLGNSGYMKEMLLWVKRTRVRNDGRGQWYANTAERPWVCEIGDIHITEDYTNQIGDYTIKYISRSLNFTVSNVTETKTTRKVTLPNNTNFIHDLFNTGVSFAGQVNGTIPFREDIIDFSDSGIVGLVDAKIIVGVGQGDNSSVVFYGVSMVPATIEDLALIESTPGYDENTHYYVGTGIVDIRKQPVIGYKATSADLTTNSAKLQLLYFGFNNGISPEYAIDESTDINPIHKIREILTDDTAMGKLEADVHDANFKKAADQIWDEGLGISWVIDEKLCIEAIEELCYHIEAGIRVNRQTGLYEMVLFRDDWFDEEEIHTIAENKIKDLHLEVMNSDDIVNQLNVTYYDRQRIKNSTFSIYENGSILTMGHANAESVEFPYFMNMRNAEIVANWKLKQFSTPAWSGSFTTGWKEARKWNRYDLIHLPWSKKWNGTILVRIMKINLGNGTNNTVTVDFEEVVPYSGEMNTSIVVDDPSESAPQPPQPSVNAVFEAPYYLTVLRTGQTNTDLELSNNPEIGYVAAIAAKPQNNSLNALLYTDGGIGEFEQVSRLDYCDILQLDHPITETTSSFVVTGSLTQTVNSNNLILLNDELIGFLSFDNATKVLTVKRGVLDTVPKKHSSGSLFVFDLPDVAFDSTQYTQSEIVEAQVLTTTPSGIQELSETGKSIEIQSRAIRPYPPANVKINNEYYPSLVRGNINLAWSHRNRLQQTGGMPLGWYDAGITAEEGTLYIVNLYNSLNDLLVTKTTDTDSIVISQDEFSASAVRLEVSSVRDEYECSQKFVHEFAVESAVNQLKFESGYVRPSSSSVVLKFKE